MLTARELFRRRARRTRHLLRETAAGRPRLCVHRSARQTYAQLIDDQSGRTLVAASSLEKDVKAQHANGGNAAAAAAVGALVGQRIREAGITAVVFDRGGYKYHGRVKALADAARAAGLEF